MQQKSKATKENGCKLNVKYVALGQETSSVNQEKRIVAPPSPAMNTTSNTYRTSILVMGTSSKVAAANNLAVGTKR